jgi:hypothetical protein
MGIATETGFEHLSVRRIRGLGWRRICLLCGAASTLLYFGMDVAASVLYDGYHYRDQTISELSAVDAPTRSLWLPLGFLYSVLVVTGGIGIWASAGRRRAVRLVGGLVTASGITGLAGWPFAPMHCREALAAGGGTFSDTMHLILAAVNTMLFLLMMAFGATAFGNRFRRYSIVTILTVLVFGGLTGLDASKVEATRADAVAGSEGTRGRLRLDDMDLAVRGRPSKSEGRGRADMTSLDRLRQHSSGGHS